MSDSNGPPADGPVTEPLLTRDRASNPPPPPAESQVETHWVEVRTRAAYRAGSFAGWIDLKCCECIADGPGDGIESDWEALYRTPGGCFLVSYSICNDNPKNVDDQVWSYAFFITELQAAGWFADDPESAPECMRALVEKFDLTRAPAAAITSELAAAAPSRNGRATEGNGTVATKCAPSIIERETPSWNKETMTLSYKGKATTLRADAQTRSDVFNWFEAAGWRKVKIADLDIVKDAGQVSNLVRRAKATARRIGFVIKRTGEELEWTDQG